MRKDRSSFPWYIIYTPVITLILIVWRLDTTAGNVFMSILEKILKWLHVDDSTMANIVIICIALIALIYIVAKWISANKHLKAINKIANTAPNTLNERIGNAEEEICKKIDKKSEKFIEDITEIKSSAGAVQRQIESFSQYRQGVPAQQDQVISIICGMYAMHDEDQKKIAMLTDQITQLKNENAKLRSELLEKAQTYQKITPTNDDLEFDGWAPEM